jgi:CBS domain-containing protein
MGLTARDIMDTRNFTLRPETTIAAALQLFQQAGAQQRQTVFGMAVIDDQGRLVGMLSMYDILLLLRPKHIHIWGEMQDLEISGLLDIAYQRARGVLVGDIMTTEIVTVTPETHLLKIIDIMIKKHIRRLPVLEEEKMVGMVYISRVFNRLLERFAT